MNVRDVKYYLLFKNCGTTNKDNKSFYRFIVGVNAGFCITCFVSEDVYNSFNVLDELTDFIGFTQNDDGKHYYIKLS